MYILDPFALRCVARAIHHCRLCFVGKQTQVTGLRQHYSVVSCSHFESHYVCVFNIYIYITYSHSCREKKSIGVKELSRLILLARVRWRTQFRFHWIEKKEKEKRSWFWSRIERGGKMVLKIESNCKLLWTVLIPMFSLLFLLHLYDSRLNFAGLIISTAHSTLHSIGNDENIYKML